ncbi:DUF481 domain-containing protein [Thiohalobacter thiocyanaticus]|uniref:DUF481 domain-containing protein n=1 Tax=Thiohalobacter thiocyanaticus TaxID=585455 RepID=A0A426QIB9_9GAMM|nr:DUF481 domain-containing protein [Thiohalobacter thiocyanaticus]RRQ21487.1 DUF481 domain-containing protein [Thiohalobacter thiocyanaticus]
MRRTGLPIPCPTLALALLLTSTGADADTLIMNNGDRLTGTVVTKRENILTLDTPYAGTLSIQWSEVRQLISEKPVQVILEDETRLTGTLLPTEDGKVRIRADEVMETAPIALSAVRYINPPVEVNGGVRIKGRVNVGVNISSGNTDTEQYHLDTEVVARTLENRFTVGATFNRTTDSGTETESNATGYGKYDHFVSEKWYNYANALFTRDELKDLKLRTTLGLGSGYQFFESEPLNLSLEGGLTYVNEDFYDKEDESYPAGRWALNYDRLLFGSRIRFFHYHEGLAGLEDVDDIMILSRTGLRAPLGQGLTATAQVDVDWDNTPAVGNDSTDTRYLLNVGYEW